MSSVAPRALDVRPLASSRKCATVLAAFDRLEAGETDEAVASVGGKPPEEGVVAHHVLDAGAGHIHNGDE